MGGEKSVCIISSFCTISVKSLLNYCFAIRICHFLATPPTNSRIVAQTSNVALPRFLRNSRFVPLFLRSANGLYTLAKCVPFGQVNEEARYLLDVAVTYCQLRIHKFILPCETGRIWNPKIYDRPLR